MTRRWKVALFLAVILLLAMGISLGWSAPQKAPETPTFVLHGDKAPLFTAKDRELIATYYEHLLGALAPGSLDRSTFSLAVEKSLVAGSRVPVQLEKDLEPLPGKLESELSPIMGDYRRYKLGHHVVLIKKADLTITDILKNVG